LPTQTPPKIDTTTLLEQAKAHEQAKADHIAALLAEREDIIESHEKRLTDSVRP
jgi:hypothetical protein